MSKIVFTFGLSAGIIFLTFMFGAIPFRKSGIITFENGEIIGYVLMVIAFSMVFAGIKLHRDRNLEGLITFGEALKVGLLITLIASIGYAVAWEFYLKFAARDFMDEYTAFRLQKAVNSGVNDAGIRSLWDEMEQIKELYKNPLLRFGMTLTEILPVGILISLISSVLLKKNELIINKPIVHE
ncbi:MAG: DUF4199 domain-containing protein [Cyclobacteriaceae bacterium]|nr:DUF4199 domain-containing protein [Cyclobacteriaceae bacterium]